MPVLSSAPALVARPLTLGGCVCLLATLVWLAAAGPVAAQESRLPATLGEAHLETLPDFNSAPSAPAAAATPSDTAHPWWGAGLTLAAPGLLAAPVAWGLWLPALAAPAALTVGHLYAGEPQRAAWIAVGGASASLLGALGGAGLGQGMGLPTAASALAGTGIGFGGFASWAAWDAYQLIAQRKHDASVTAAVSTR